MHLPKETCKRAMFEKSKISTRFARVCAEALQFSRLHHQHGTSLSQTVLVYGRPRSFGPYFSAAVAVRGGVSVPDLSRVRLQMLERMCPQYTFEQHMAYALPHPRDIVSECPEKRKERHQLGRLYKWHGRVLFKSDNTRGHFGIDA